MPSAVGALSGYAVYGMARGTGLDPVWSFPTPPSLRPSHLAVGLAAGVAGAAVAVVFTYLTVALRWVFHRAPALGRPLLGGLVLGGLALLSPYALTFGEGQIDTVVATRLGVGTLVLAAVCKLVAASTMMSSGWRGGFIIPLFFLGVVLGTLAARVLHTDRTITMLALMAACCVGVTKTPFGSTLVVTGMTGLSVLPPVLLAAVVALILTSWVGLIETQRERDAIVTP